MPDEAYGTTQIREIRFSAAEVRNILLENLRARAKTPYDFDYDSPIVLDDEDGGYIFRFVQKAVTLERETDRLDFRPMPKASTQENGEGDG